MPKRNLSQENMLNKWRLLYEFKTDNENSCVYLQQLFYSLRVNYEVETNLERTDAERQFVRDVSKKLQMCRQMTDDAALKKEIEKAYDAVRSCPLKSNDMAMNYEIKIIGLTDTLESKMDNNQNQEVPVIVQDILNNVKKRNAML